MWLKVILIGIIFAWGTTLSSGCDKKEICVNDNLTKEVVSNKYGKNNGEKIKVNENKYEENQEKAYEKYINPRFGYSLSYPDKFKITKESDNGDGVELNFEDSKIIVYGSNNVLQDSAKSLYESELKEISKKDLIESSLENITYYIKWKEGDFLKYKKSTVGEESINSFEVIYPLSKEKEFVDIISKLSGTFKTPNVDKMG